MKRALVFAVAVAAAAPGGARAADDVAVQVAVDKARPAADEFVHLTYTFTGGGLSGSLRVPSPIPLRNLSVAGGPSRSEQVSYVNGVFSRTLSITYVLRPLGPGPAEIGEASFGFGDKTVKAASYLLEVGAARPASSSQRAPQQEPEPEDPLSQFFRRRDGAGSPRTERGARPFVEFRVTPDKTTAYVGEEITLTYELLTQADVQGLEYLESPKFPGLWAEDLEKPERPEGRRDVVDGRTVMRFTLLKKAVSGLTPGAVTVPEAKIRTSVRVGPDPFGDPFGFFPRPQVLDLVAKPVSLKILAVPGRPDFKGPVGRFELTAKIDRTRVAAGDAATFKVRLSGTGNLRTASEAPRLEVAGAKVYPPSTKTDASHLGRTQASTEWSWVLVPTAKGTVTIPPVSVDIFDPVEKRVVAKATQPVTLVVEGGPAGTETSSAAASTAPAETTLPGPGAPPRPMPAPALEPTPARAAVDMSRGTVTLPLWALAAIPGAALAAAGAFVFARRRRGRDAFRQALAPEPGETKERAAARVDRALREALARRHGISETLGASELLAALKDRGLPEARLADVKALLDDVDFLRFAPQLGEYDARIREVRERAARVLPLVA
ncbi:MAG: BatD family protein [Acidobacteriota bacterium]